MPQQNRQFVARDEELKGIKNWDKKLLAICASGGSGKTSVALEAAHRMKAANPAMSFFWLTSDDYNVENSQVLDGSVEQLVGSLGLKSSSGSCLKPVNLLLAYFEKLENDFVVAVDNLDQDTFTQTAKELITGNWLQNKHAKLLITTRRNEKGVQDFFKQQYKLESLTCKPWPWYKLQLSKPSEDSDGVTLSLNCLSKEDGGKLIEEAVGAKSPNQEAQQISYLLDGLPLALSVVACVISLVYDSDFKSFYKEFRETRNRLDMLLDPRDRNIDLKKTLAAQIKILEERCPEAIFILRMIATGQKLLEFFDEVHLNEGWTEDQFKEIEFDEVKQIIPPEMRDEHKRKAAIAKLRKFNLIEKTRFGGYEMHRVLADIVRQECSKAEKLKFQMAAIVTNLFRLQSRQMFPGLFDIPIYYLTRVPDIFSGVDDSDQQLVRKFLMTEIHLLLKQILVLWGEKAKRLGDLSSEECKKQVEMFLEEALEENRKKISWNRSLDEYERQLINCHMMLQSYREKLKI